MADLFQVGLGGNFGAQHVAQDVHVTGSAPIDLGLIQLSSSEPQAAWVAPVLNLSEDHSRASHILPPSSPFDLGRGCHSGANSAPTQPTTTPPPVYDVGVSGHLSRETSGQPPLLWPSSMGTLRKP